MIGADTRAVSVAVTHALMLAVTALLITGLLIGAGSLLESQTERVARQEVDEIGADVRSHLAIYARLNASVGTATAELVLDYPPTVVGEPYTVALVHDSGPFDADSTLRIDAAALEDAVSYPVPADTRVVESSARGEEFRLSLCSNGSVLLGRC